MAEGTCTATTAPMCRSPVRVCFASTMSPTRSSSGTPARMCVSRRAAAAACNGSGDEAKEADDEGDDADKDDNEIESSKGETVAPE